MGIDIASTDFTEADLSDANLSGTDLTFSRLSEANLSRANLSGTDLKNKDLIEVNLSGANLSGANLSGANFSRETNSGPHRVANLSGANLNGANLSGANFSFTDLRLANLSGADVRSANFSHANLSGTDLTRADLTRADVSDADLSSANLSAANLKGMNLSANYCGVTLRGANLSGANLSRANLCGTDLRSTDLSGADLSYTNLRFTDLSGANIDGADFRFAKNRVSYTQFTNDGIIVSTPMSRSIRTQRELAMIDSAIRDRESLHPECEMCRRSTVVLHTELPPGSLPVFSRENFLAVGRYCEKCANIFCSACASAMAGATGVTGPGTCPICHCPLDFAANSHLKSTSNRVQEFHLLRKWWQFWVAPPKSTLSREKKHIIPALPATILHLAVESAQNEIAKWEKIAEDSRNPMKRDLAREVKASAVARCLIRGDDASGMILRFERNDSIFDSNLAEQNAQRRSCQPDQGKFYSPSRGIVWLDAGAFQLVRSQPQQGLSSFQVISFAVIGLLDLAMTDELAKAAAENKFEMKRFDDGTFEVTIPQEVL